MFEIRTFQSGGLILDDNKDTTKGRALERITIPSELVIPVIQHIGRPARAIVKENDMVLKGRLIAEADGMVSANIHAPTSGKIVRVEKRTEIHGKICDHIILEPDGLDRWLPICNRKRDWRAMDISCVREAIRSAGIVGMGGAAFPTHVKLAPQEESKIEALILNGIEGEPYISCDYRMMKERTKGIVEGMRIILALLGIKRVYVGVSEDKADAYKLIRDATWADDSVEVHLLETKYPQGAERLLIEAIIGRELRPKELPIHAGFVVTNVSTAFAIYEAVVESKPLIERAVTVAGDGIARSANLICPIGTKISALLEKQGFDSTTSKVLLGGPMMGVALPTLEVPVIKGTTGVLALKRISNAPTGPCIRCGRCIEACAWRYCAVLMLEAIEMHQVDRYEELSVLECSECGACAYVCPSRIPLVQHIRKAKGEWSASQ